MKIKVKLPFDYASDGIHVQHYPAGEIEIDDVGAEIAVREGWAELPASAKKSASVKKAEPEPIDDTLPQPQAVTTGEEGSDAPAA